MPHTPDIPHSGSAYALTRFFVRLLIFSIFAALGSQGFGKTCVSAWNKDPVFGVIGIQSGPRH